MVLKCDPCREKNRPPISRATSASPRMEAALPPSSPPISCKGVPCSVLFCRLYFAATRVCACFPQAPLVFPFKNYIRKKRC